MEENLKNVRVESDLIGSLEVPAEALYGVQTLRGLENFPISSFHLKDYPLFVNGLAMTKLAAAEANYQLGLLTDVQYRGITQACREILDGKHHEHDILSKEDLDTILSPENMIKPVKLDIKVK